VLYGTTSVGGSRKHCGDDNHGCGTAFALVPAAASSTQWQAAALHAFTGAAVDGSLPLAALATDAAGDLYGTSIGKGGSSACVSSCGTIFALTRPAGGQRWKHKVLHRFGGGSVDGSGPLARVIVGADGALYGTTRWGGAANRGIVFKLTH
jgi:uncharacterized repeat protein (TIGR03803 family)